MEFKTTGNRVLIEREPSEKLTSSGFIIPTLEKESNYYGYVRGIGPGRVTRKKVVIPMSVTIGDKVLFDPNGALPISLEGKDYLIVKEDDIVTIVDPETNRGIG